MVQLFGLIFVVICDFFRGWVGWVYWNLKLGYSILLFEGVQYLYNFFFPHFFKPFCAFCKKSGCSYEHPDQWVEPPLNAMRTKWIHLHNHGSALLKSRFYNCQINVTSLSDCFFGWIFLHYHFAKLGCISICPTQCFLLTFQETRLKFCLFESNWRVQSYLQPID